MRAAIARPEIASGHARRIHRAPRRWADSRPPRTGVPRPAELAIGNPGEPAEWKRLGHEQHGVALHPVGERVGQLARRSLAGMSRHRRLVEAGPAGQAEAERQVHVLDVGEEALVEGTHLEHARRGGRPPRRRRPRTPHRECRSARRRARSARAARRRRHGGARLRRRRAGRGRPGPPSWRLRRRRAGRPRSRPPSARASRGRAPRCCSPVPPDRRSRPRSRGSRRGRSRCWWPAPPP